MSMPVLPRNGAKNMGFVTSLTTYCSKSWCTSSLQGPCDVTHITLPYTFTRCQYGSRFTKS